MKALYVLSNVGLLSVFLCQHIGIHFTANDTKLAGPFIAFNGGRLSRYATAALICTSIALIHTTTAQNDISIVWSQQKSLANAKVSARQQRVYEGPKRRILRQIK